MNVSDMTWQQAADKWSQGLDVWSAELGGIGPSYEQAIQNLLFEILVQIPKSTTYPTNLHKYPEDFEMVVKRCVNKLNQTHGFSGAQVDAAKATAFQFITYGYKHMMEKLPDERAILVCKSFPRSDA